MGGKKSKRAILDLLKVNGPTSAENLAEQLQITAMAVRQHLYALSESGLVDFLEQPQEVGRPLKLWKLTEAANSEFTDRHDELIVDLLDSVREAVGESALDQIIDHRARRQLKRYQDEIDSRSDLKGKLDVLSKLRSEEGYMAEVELRSDGSYLLIENHCPICKAATACQQFCRNELKLFQDVLGKNVSVKRDEYIIDGQRRCTYIVTEDH